MVKFVILLVAGLMATTSCLAHGLHKNHCMMTWGKMDFDQDKFSGEWYVVAKILSGALPKMESTCNKMEVVAKQDGNVTRVTSTFSVKMEGHEVKFIAKSQPMFPRLTSLSQATWKKEGDDHWMGVFSQSILATDYEHFAVSYACKPVYDEETDSFNKMEIVNVMSRKPEMESALLGVLKNVLGGFSFDVSEMMMVDNTNC